MYPMTPLEQAAFWVEMLGADPERAAAYERVDLDELLLLLSSRSAVEF